MFASKSFQNDRDFLLASKQKYICLILCISITSGTKKVVYFPGDRHSLSNCSWESVQKDQETVLREVVVFCPPLKDFSEFNLHLLIPITSHRSRPHLIQRERNHP